MTHGGSVEHIVRYVVEGDQVVVFLTNHRAPTARSTAAITPANSSSP